MTPSLLAVLILLLATESLAAPQLDHGQYRATLTISANRELAGRATYTRCGQILHVWLFDTLSPDVSMEFGTRVPKLQSGFFQAQPMGLLGPLPPTKRDRWATGYFSLYVPRDTLFFADSGRLHLAHVEPSEIDGEIRYGVSEAWKGKSRSRGTVVGTFRAIRDTVHERTLYNGARCDHPGEEWPLHDQDE